MTEQEQDMTSRASTTEQDKQVEDKRGMQDRTSQEKTRPRQHLDEDRLDRTEHRGQKTDRQTDRQDAQI